MDTRHPMTNVTTDTQQCVLSLEQVSKHYKLYAKPSDRLRQFFWGKRRQYFRIFQALDTVDLCIRKGQVLGVIGQNGAGKSTLLQLIAGTLTPSTGQINITGRVAALLELGAGFNPEFSGAENIRLYGLLMGLSTQEIEARFQSIVDFSGIEAFIHQPVKTYSSGMFVRLAFSIATSVDPDILIIDEALSVGDGAFARKSFDRIMALRDQGVTIIFCSHALYQIQVLSDQVLWLNAGKIQAMGEPREVVMAYQQFLDQQQTETTQPMTSDKPNHPEAAAHGARLTDVKVSVDAQSGELQMAVAEQSDMQIDVHFIADPNKPCPQVAVVITSEDGRNISSCTTYHDRYPLTLNSQGEGQVSLCFHKLPLMHGRYWVNVLLMCENAVMTLDGVYRLTKIEVEQAGHEVGITFLPRAWSSPQ